MYLPILSTKTGKRMKKKNFHNRFLTIFKHLQCKTKLLNTSGLRVPTQLSYRCAPNFFLSSKKTSVLRQCIRPGTYQGQAVAAADPYPNLQPRLEGAHKRKGPACSHLEASPAPSGSSRKDSSLDTFHAG